MTREKVIEGCSIARDSYSKREEDFVAAYSDRVGAGMTEANEDIKRIDGEFDVESSRGIYSRWVRELDVQVSMGSRTNVVAETNGPIKLE